MTGSAVERRDPVALARAEDERQWDNLYRRATVLSRTKLVPKECQGNPDATMAAFLTLAAHGIQPNAGSMGLLHFIDGRPEPSAQLYAALLGRHGYDILWTALTSTRASARLRRPDGTETIEVEWTIDQARAADLLDVWVEKRTADGKWPDGNPRWRVERFVLDRPGVTEPGWVAEERAAGRTKRNENWWRFPDDMLASKVIRRLVKRFAAHVSLGVDPDEDIRQTYVSPPPGGSDIVDAEIVDEPADPPGAGVDALVDTDWVRRFMARCDEQATIRKLHGPDLAEAIVSAATHGRTGRPEDVQVGEASSVAAITADVIGGHVDVTISDAGVTIGPVQ